MTGTIAGSGSATVGTTAAAITAPGTQCMRVVLSAPAANTAAVLIGNKTAQAFSLAAGQTVALDIVDPSLVWASVATGTQTLDWIATA